MKVKWKKRFYRPNVNGNVREISRCGLQKWSSNWRDFTTVIFNKIRTPLCCQAVILSVLDFNVQWITWFYVHVKVLKMCIRLFFMCKGCTEMANWQFTISEMASMRTTYMYVLQRAKIAQKLISLRCSCQKNREALTDSSNCLELKIKPTDLSRTEDFTYHEARIFNLCKPSVGTPLV